MSGGFQGLHPVLGGKAVVCCVHDRQKRQVTTERQVFELGVSAGLVFDPVQHKIHRCACCQNLFVAFSDEPRYCSICNRVPVHALGGPLAPPIGEVDA
jgi:hypothetical protein